MHICDWILLKHFDVYCNPIWRLDFQNIEEAVNHLFFCKKAERKQRASDIFLLKHVKAG